MTKEAGRMLYYGTRLSENISRRDSATSIGAEALHPPLLVSVDLSANETSRTAGRRRFAPKAFRLIN